MLNIIKVTLFVLVNIAGWYTIPILANLASKIGFFPQLPVGQATEDFKLWFLGGGTWVFIGGFFASIGYFFSREELKNWLLFAPMYAPALFGFAVLIYFSFFYTIS